MLCLRLKNVERDGGVMNCCCVVLIARPLSIGGDSIAREARFSIGTNNKKPCCKDINQRHTGV